MVSLSFLVIKSMTTWNNVKSLYNYTLYLCKDLYYYAKDYYHGCNDTWVFITGHTFPMSLSNINNTKNLDMDAYWVYDNNNCELCLCEDSTRCTFSWLSSKVIIHSQKNVYEHNMDDFIQNLSVYMKDTPPSLYIIYMCWCIYNKQWFTLDDKITFHIFEDTGEEVTVTLNEALFIKDNKLFISKTI